MSLWLKTSFLGFRGFVVLWTALSFLGFSTAVYNADFHDKLHPHEMHAEGHVDSHNSHHHPESEQDSHESDASCYVCSVHNHIVANFSQAIQVSNNIDSLPEFIDTGRKSFYHSQLFYSVSGRAPPVAL